MTEKQYPPTGGGVGALSGLTIDVDKDWGGYSITNLGQVSVGDIEMANEWRLTEHPEHGVILLSPDGKGFKLVKKELE